MEQLLCATHKYLTALCTLLMQVPSDGVELDRTLLKIAHWVSLVPFMDDAAFRKNRHGIWCTTADFLHLGGGDHEEHANLLAGYFTELQQEVGGAVSREATQQDREQPASRQAPGAFTNCTTLM